MINDLNKLKIYYDAEMTSLTKDSELISIGFVSESGSIFYAEISDVDTSSVSDWIKDNVLANCILHDQDYSMYEYSADNKLYSRYIKRKREVVANELNTWLKNEAHRSGKQIQIYCDCYAYDWVLLMDLITYEGSALDNPDYLYYIPVDLCSVLQTYGIDPDASREELAPVPHRIIEDRIRADLGIDDTTVSMKHNSLYDAFIVSYIYKNLDAIKLLSK